LGKKKENLVKSECQDEECRPDPLMKRRTGGETTAPPNDVHSPRIQEGSENQGVLNHTPEGQGAVRKKEKNPRPWANGSRGGTVKGGVGRGKVPRPGANKTGDCR